MNLAQLREKAKQKRSGGHLYRFDPVGCVWRRHAFAHTAYNAAKVSGKGYGQAVNFYTSRNIGCVGDWCLITRKATEHPAPRQRLIYSFTGCDGSTVKHWGLSRASEALGVNEFTIRRWAKAGKSKRFPVVTASRKADLVMSKF